MRIAMIGTGYVGLVSGTCFSEFGFHVTCVDKNAEKIRKLEQNIVPIYEIGLEALVARNRAARRLHFSTELAAAVKASDVAIIAVGTPPDPESGHADLSHVYQAAEEIGKALESYTLVITKSTVPVGTGAKIREIIRKANPGAEFDVASNPEFLREGSAIEDFMKPDRIVAGTESERARDIIGALYRPLFINETPLVFTSVETAELTKYAANAFLATKIAFINEIADIAEKVGANIKDIAKGIGLDKRIGRQFLNAGPGYGGSCFPKDTRALMKTAEDVGAPSRIVQTVVASNEFRKLSMVTKIIDACNGSLKGKHIGVLGLTFKPNTDDMRESPALRIVPALLEAGATVAAYDPKGMEEAKKLLPEKNIAWAKDAYEAAINADALVILTEWNEFRSLNLGELKARMKTPVMIDMRNIYKLKEMEKAGFRYISIGRRRIG